ncbi:hypothetical protein [Altericroceibacterium xinjiangense]|uniref:hypothetical protein n=1 Tax=Altericroceibacterium xinjiangense TaxID=762261 RepID=UPI000F7E14A6|nr:hypothetical protein [Altericroceibacterium xinjiangense]
MKTMKSVLASVAAAGLLVSQPLAAAPARADSASKQTEGMAGFGAGGPMVATIAVLAVAIAALVPVVFDDDDDVTVPVSP